MHTPILKVILTANKKQKKNKQTQRNGFCVLSKNHYINKSIIVYLYTTIMSYAYY